MFPLVVTQGHVVRPVELVVVPGGDEDVHRVSDHGEVGGPAAVPHHAADPLVVKSGEERRLRYVAVFEYLVLSFHLE